MWKKNFVVPWNNGKSEKINNMGCLGVKFLNCCTCIFVESNARMQETVDLKNNVELVRSVSDKLLRPSARNYSIFRGTNIKDMSIYLVKKSLFLMASPFLSNNILCSKWRFPVAHNYYFNSTGLDKALHIPIVLWIQPQAPNFLETEFYELYAANQCFFCLKSWQLYVHGRTSNRCCRPWKGKRTTKPDFMINHFHFSDVELDGSRKFLFGFLCPPMWFYATILYFGNHYKKDPRERAGLGASAIAALVCTVASLIIAVILMLRWWFFQLPGVN
ncbi:hypothetical protein Ahy_Scaffold9g108571 isoform B [Arachis hypogaea]|uniref:Uncharacterized protein n=1 Tax=Arachis hypogaea TaxID=3818 RepID=A0A444WMS3_ARAHY|nr:hypothetical protein Ahy_Scaffold9g108571 isoform B [Arachis hypogaea]